MSSKTLAAAMAVIVLGACQDTPSEPIQAAVGAGVVQVHYPVSLPIWNPCSPVPETVQVDGVVHQLNIVRGNTLDTRSNWADVKGIGLTTGNDYIIRENWREHRVLIPPSGSRVKFSDHLRVISKGAPDNFELVVEVIITDPPYNAVLTNYRYECRG